MPPFEQYLISRQQNCYKGELRCKDNPPTPECIPDQYTTFFRKRWDALGRDPCKNRTAWDPSTFCRLKYRTPADKGCDLDEVCLSPQSHYVTQYGKHYARPWDHNNIDDCCKEPCPCVPPCPSNVDCRYLCKTREPLPPLDDCTTYNSQFCRKPVGPPPRRCIPRCWDPCCCKTDGCTTYRLAYPHKACVPNGPVGAQVTKHGMWSMEQFSCCPLAQETEHLCQFPPKCRPRRPSIYPCNNLHPGRGPFARASETCYQFGPKSVDYPPIPPWVETEPDWIPPCPKLDDCTTYQHFYPWHDFGDVQPPCEIKSPGAIPFPTMNNMWYTCYDPPVDQRTPVEVKDNDPWPYVKPCPIRYTDNELIDPCAPFRDETTQKADYTPKRKCVPTKNYKPIDGYTPPIQPMNDDTTQKCSYPAYATCAAKCAKGGAGNPCGKFWGPFTCPETEDKCLPRFPAPYGHPLKPFTKQCPCGPFDDRSTYHQDFKFRSKEMVQLLEDEMCEEFCVPKGASVYRHDFVEQNGAPAEVIPPPPNKGYRCIQPCSMIDTDTLYRKTFVDFWKKVSPDKLQLYRARRTDPVALQREAEMSAACAGQTEIIAMPPGTTVEDVLQGLAPGTSAKNLFRGQKPGEKKCRPCPGETTIEATPLGTTVADVIAVCSGNANCGGCGEGGNCGARKQDPCCRLTGNACKLIH